jgi:ankyrin repeat protein
MKRKNISCIIVCCIFCAVVIGVARVSVSTAAGDRQSTSLDQKLLKAVRDGKIDSVRSAIRQGANVNVSTEFGETPLHLVNNVKIAETLIRAGANVHAKDREFAMTPLFNADINVSRVLIANGAQVNVRAKKGMTPLAWAVYWDQKEKAGLLIEKGADLNAADDDGKSALHVAANWGKMEIARLLISKGADVNAKDSACWTPLHWAAFEGTSEIMNLLISAGADCNAVSCQPDNTLPSGETPLDVAMRWRSPDVAAYLKSRGCKHANVTENPSHTP